ncbi:hypothetical protein J8655_12470 [Dickeya oryzae]|uniref:hypothetical protein n=1 Tax=Dickeya oryzae TaxID=1240404 RepID=UPI001AEC856D|nr:hypothetical protein [Dickeya oryzae]MBP2846292.1 hypothetical protein [Dickeya oryzae]
MGTLGDSFPEKFRSAFGQARGILPGDVLYLYCQFTTPPKVKFLLVACCEPLLVLVINSEIHAFIEKNDELRACQVELPLSDHDFLDWDSYVNCIDAHAAFSLDDVKARISADYGNVLKGRVADYCLRQVYIAVNSSPTMKRGQKRKILEALREYQ